MMEIEVRDGSVHASEGALVRALDGEGEAEERQRVRAHAAACARCGERMERIRHRSLRLSELLGEADADASGEGLPPPVQDDLARARVHRQAPRPASLPGWMRVAAGVLLLLGIGISVSPLRAWVVERWTEVALLFAAPEPMAAPEPPRAPAGHIVSFFPEGDEFLLQVDLPQAEGRLELLIAEVPRASAEISAEAAGETLLVLPEGLRIRNARSSRASYHVTLPAELRRVRVRIGEGQEATYTPRSLTLPARRVLDLRVSGAP